MSWVSQVLILLALVAQPLVGQQPELRRITAPLPDIPRLVQPDSAERVAIMLAILDQGIAYLVSYGGMNRLRLFPYAAFMRPVDRDSLRRLAERHPRLRLCGPAFSRCVGPYPHIAVVGMEAFTPGQVLIRLAWSPGPEACAWREWVSPAWKWDRETELGVYPLTMERSRDTFYGHSFCYRGLGSHGEPGLIASRGVEGWLITPAGPLRPRTPNGRLELDGRGEPNR